MNKSLTFISKFFSFLLSTVFLVILLALVCLFLTERFISKDTISTVVENVDLKEVKINNNSNYKNAFDYVYSYTSQLGLTEKETEELLKEKDVNNILTEYFSNITNYYLYGYNIPTYTKEKVMLDITKINNLLSVENQINLNDDELIEATNQINDLSQDLASKQVLNSSKISFITHKDSYINNAKIYMLISLTIIFFLIALVRFKLYSPLGWCGIPTMIVGSFYMLFSLTRYVINIFKESLEDYQYLIDLLSKSILNKSLVYGIATFLVGLLMTIAYNIIRDRKEYKDEIMDDNKSEEELDRL